MSNTNKQMATKGMVLIAGLTAAAACASIESSEPETKSASSALNANPTATAGTALGTNRERSFGASCALWDTTLGRDVLISAFGYKGNGAGGPTYLNTYDVYDPGGPSWTAGPNPVQQTVLGVTTTATAAAYVAAVTDPDTVANNNADRRTTCYFAGGFDGTNLSAQVWKATVANKAVTWTKLTNMNVARARFGLSWGGTTTKKLIAVGGGVDGTGRTNTIETFDRATPGTWVTATSSGGVTRTLNEAVGGFGFVKLSDTKFVTAGGDGAVNNPSDHINAIKVNANGTVDSVGDILNSGATVITARKDNIVVPTGTNSGMSGTDPVEIMVAMGRSNATTLVAAAERVVIDWNSGTTAPSYVSKSTGTAPTTNAAFPTVVDAYVAPQAAAASPGYIIVSGVNSANPQLSTDKIRKWTPSTGATGGAWGTEANFAAQARTGVDAIYIKSIDEVIASGGTDRYPQSTSSVDYLNTDRIQ